MAIERASLADDAFVPARHVEDAYREMAGAVFRKAS